ncbi:hypothetical protein EDD22DRAFT_883766 [Suillus occidentalis]|nr:hypothetical protein EDD22DRAFT_883766 [Suillus occidentalis]
MGRLLKSHRKMIPPHRIAFTACGFHSFITNVGHTDRFVLLNNLANQLSTRFHRRGNDEDLDEALCPVGHSVLPMALNNLASQLFIRFTHQGIVTNLVQYTSDMMIIPRLIIFDGAKDSILFSRNLISPTCI